MTADAHTDHDGTREPLVSIGMPVFNGERYIEQALRALLAQEHRRLELIVSDNASTDRTEAIVRAAAERDGRVRYHRNASNLGALPNAQRTLDEAQGDYFMWAAHDDLWEPAYVGTLVRLLQARPDAVLAFCALDNIDEEGRRLRTCPALFSLPEPDLYARLHTYLVQPEIDGKANLFYGLFRTAVLRAAGGTTAQPPDREAADLLIVFRVLSLGDLVLAPELLFHKRHVVEAPSIAPGGGRRTGRGWRVDLAQRLAYFNGYEPLIEQVEGLDADQRAALRRVIRTRARAWGRSVRWRKLVLNRLRRPFRALRRAFGRRSS